MASTRKPYLATSYHDMMRHIYAKPKGHSEGLKPYMSETYTAMEYPELNKYGEFIPESYTGGGVGGGGIPTEPIPPVEPLPHWTILSCLHLNSLCYCINCEEIGSLINVPCTEPMDPDCQTLFCDNPDDPCPPFTLTGNVAQAVAPVTLCPSTQICAVSISGGTAVGQCIYVPDVGCGTKSVCVTDICGNEVCVEVRMSSGVWVLVSEVYNSTVMDEAPPYYVYCCKSPLTPPYESNYCVNPGAQNCEVISGGTNLLYNGICVPTGHAGTACGSPPCSFSCSGTEVGIVFRTQTYRWVCP